ncbi:MAG: YcxB family protein [Lachnospiraceae bacterium]|nr:YcxB family protein [Lachnospiraceae bacterium]MBQ2405348.1 YcxB family protein [Lachnospiraceae bacterium]MEE0918786.1 YcxB family protein [Lachnospiraceae bacterium]
MELDFDVKINATVLYDYLLYHTYTGMTGLLATISGALAIMGFASTHYFIYLIVGVVLIGYLPCNLFIKANQQATLTPAFKKPLHYVMNEEGICVSQGESKEKQSWETCYKAVSTSKSIIVYTSKTTASIFPKKDLGDKKDAIIKMISTHMPPNKVKIRF